MVPKCARTLVPLTGTWPVLAGERARGRDAFRKIAVPEFRMVSAERGPDTRTRQED